MAKLKNFIRIITNDYPKESQKIVEKLAGPINDGFSELYFALNQRLTLSENMSGTVRNIELTVDSNGLPINTSRIGLSTTTTVIGCSILRAVNLDNSATYPTSSPFISFTQFGSSLQIDHITGLQANQRYSLTIVAYN